jgi:hypothetical protein
MAQAAEIRGVSIVLLGHFTPVIFQPLWFSTQNLLSKSEAEAAQVELIHPRATIFSANWLQVNVIEDRFQAATAQVPYFEMLRDLVSGAFQVLNQTPVQALGINCDFHFPLGSEERWHGFGHKVAPKELWSKTLKSPGLLSLTMTSLRSDEYEGHIQVRVEPSIRVRFGVYINVNDHYQLAKAQEIQAGTAGVVSILASKWQESMDRAHSIIKGVLDSGDS